MSPRADWFSSEEEKLRLVPTTTSGLIRESLGRAPLSAGAGRDKETCTQISPPCFLHSMMGVRERERVLPLLKRRRRESSLHPPGDGGGSGLKSSHLPIAAPVCSDDRNQTWNLHGDSRDSDPASFIRSCGRTSTSSIYVFAARARCRSIGLHPPLMVVDI